MTFRKAAIEALKLVNNEPHSARELWEVIKERDLYSSDGKTPWATLNVVLRKNSDDPYDSVKEDSREAIFKCEGSRPARFSLTARHAMMDNEREETSTDEEEREEEKISVLTQVTSEKVEWRKIIVTDNAGNLQYETRECDSYTYIATADSANIEKVKIGMTMNTPDKRVGSMKTSNPAIRVVCAFPSELHTEKNLHNRFDNSRSEGEWFYYTKDIKKLVNNYCDLSEKVVKRYQMESKIKELDADIIELV